MGAQMYTFIVSFAIAAFILASFALPFLVLATIVGLIDALNKRQKARATHNI